MRIKIDAAGVLLALALVCGYRVPAQAGIAKVWMSTMSLSGAGQGHDVAVSADGASIYAAGTRNGLYWVAKFNASDGSVLWEYAPSTGYALGVAVGPAGQVAAIGGVVHSTWPVFVSSFSIVVLEPLHGVPLAGWPMQTTGYYDAGAVSTTPYRAAARFDKNGNLFVGWNESTTTIRVRKYSSAGAPLVEISSTAPSIYFESLAVDTNTASQGIYSMVETDKVILSRYDGSLALLNTITHPWVGTSYGRRHAVTVGPNGVIMGGQFRNLNDPANPEYTWWERYPADLSAAVWSKFERRAPAVGGNIFYGLAQRQPYCGSMYAVGDSTSAWIGLFDSIGNSWTYQKDSVAFRGDAIAADANRTVYVTGATKAGNLYLSRFDDTSCSVGPPPPPQPCTTTPSAFPNPFRPTGSNDASIQYDLLAGATGNSVTVTLSVFGPAGNLVRSSWTGQSLVAKRFNTILWNGKDDQGALVPPGTYDASLVVQMPSGAACRSLIRIGIR